MTRFDHHARILIIGGGAIGCAVAYALARQGEKDVLVLEKAQLTHGSTWHAAGLVGQLRGKRNLTRMMQNSVAIFRDLEKETGQATEWREVGSLRLAASADRLSDIRRSMTQAKSFGLECHELGPREAQSRFPFIDTKGVAGAAFIPSDGHIEPYSLTQALAKGARSNGAIIKEGICVEDIITRKGRVSGVVTDHGNWACDILVNCAGIWAKRIGEMAGVPLAAGVVEHQYFVTQKRPEISAHLPTLRDPDANFYLKPDLGAFAIGGWEEGTRCCWRSRPPFAFGRELFATNMERLELFALPAAKRLPILNEMGIQSVINGPIPVSADGEPILGPVPEFENFYMACGFTAGIAACGGAGEAMAHWILDGDPGMDLWPFDVRRFGPHHANSRYLEERAIDAYARYYKIHWPGEELGAGRKLRLGPLYQRLAGQGAVYGAKFGWERPNWFAPDHAKETMRPSLEGKPGWFDVVGEEHKAVRERAALIDQSSFAKFEISGKGAHRFLQGLAANDLGTRPGHCTYTQMCNPRGGIEADLTIMYLDEERFYIVTGSAFGVHDGHWIRSHMQDGGPVQMRDVTNQWAVINICGPEARAILAQVTDADLSNAALPFLSVRELEIGSATARAARIGYVGELGWELHIPVEYALHVYDLLMREGQAFGITNAGYRAIDSLRMEKGYLYWSADIGPDYSPFEAGLGFCVAKGKSDFIGAKALAKIRQDGVRRKLCTFLVDDFAPFHGGETIRCKGEIAGFTTSCAYGYTLGKTIAFGYLPLELCHLADFEIEAFGRGYKARRAARVNYDPEMTRLKS